MEVWRIPILVKRCLYLAYAVDLARFISYTVAVKLSLRPFPPLLFYPGCAHDISRRSVYQPKVIVEPCPVSSCEHGYQIQARLNSLIRSRQRTINPTAKKRWGNSENNLSKLLALIDTDEIVVRYIASCCSRYDIPWETIHSFFTSR